MIYRRKLYRRIKPQRAAAALPLLAFPFALLAVSGAVAQETKTDKADAPNRTDDKTPPVAGKDKNAPELPKVDTSGPPPANPLVLRDPDNGSGNSSKNFDDKGNRKEPAIRSVTDFGDWRKNSGDPRDRRARQK